MTRLSQLIFWSNIKPRNFGIFYLFQLLSYLDKYLAQNVIVFAKNKIVQDLNYLDFVKDFWCLKIHWLYENLWRIWVQYLLDFYWKLQYWYRDQLSLPLGLLLGTPSYNKEIKRSQNTRTSRRDTMLNNLSFRAIVLRATIFAIWLSKTM